MMGTDRSTGSGSTVRSANNLRGGRSSAIGQSTQDTTSVHEELKGQATEVKEQAATVAESAQQLASQAGDKLLDTVEAQKVAGADLASSMAGAMRRAANEFREVPQASQYIRYAAEQIDNISDAVRKRDLRQVVSDIEGFARRQPTAFLGAAVLVGFAAVRFLKTSTAESTGGSDSYRNPSPGYRPSSTAEGAGGSDSYRNASPGYRPNPSPRFEEPGSAT